MDQPAQSERWGVVASACAAQLVGVMGEHILLGTALMLWAYDLNHSARDVAFALGSVVVAALFSFPAGAWVSRYSARSALLGCSLLRLLATGLLAMLPRMHHSFAFVLSCVFAISLVDSFFMPALKAAIPNWVSPAKLVRSNSLLESTDIPAQLLGPLVGVSIYLHWGLAGAAWAQFAAYAIAFVMLAATRFPKRLHHESTKERKHEEEPGKLRGGRLRLTLSTAWRSMEVRRTLIAWTFGMIAAGVIQALMLPFIETELKQPESLLGIFMALMGLGMVVGAIVCSVWDLRVSDLGLIAVAGAVVTFALAVLAQSVSVVVCEAAMVGLGAGFVLVHVAATTIMQAGLDNRVRAGAIGLSHSIEAFGLLIGLAFGGALAGHFGIRHTLDGAVVLVAISTIIAGWTAWS